MNGPTPFRIDRHDLDQAVEPLEVRHRLRSGLSTAAGLVGGPERATAADGPPLQAHARRPSAPPRCSSRNAGASVSR
jgi:hypothetical protein